MSLPSFRILSSPLTTTPLQPARIIASHQITMSSVSTVALCAGIIGGDADTVMIIGEPTGRSFHHAADDPSTIRLFPGQTFRWQEILEAMNSDLKVITSNTAVMAPQPASEFETDLRKQLNQRANGATASANRQGSTAVTQGPPGTEGSVASGRAP